MNRFEIRGARWLRALGAGVFLLMLAACGGGGGGAPATDPQARTTVGAAGGEVASRDGSLKLSIPAGALAAATEITVTELSAANVPAHMGPLGAARVYRLEPAGLQFAQPATASVTLPAGNTLAALVLDSNGRGEALGDSTLRFGASSRVLTGRVAHFSHLAVVPIQSATLEIAVDDRSLLVGDHLRANVTLGKGAGDSFRVHAPGEITLGANFSLITGSSASIAQAIFDGANEIFAEGQSRELVSAFTARCQAPGNATIGLRLLVVDALAVRMRAAYGAGSLDGVARVLEVLTDVVCDPAGTSFGSIRVGIFSMPFGTAPDGIAAVPGAFTNLPDTGAPRLGISTALGYVLIDPLTGLVDLNLTQGGPIVALGANLLGAVAVSANPRGASAHAALLGFGLQAYNLLGWNPSAGEFGLNQLFGQYGALDAQHVGGDTAAPVLILSAPSRGIGFIKQGDSGYFSSDTVFIENAQLGGAPRSAAQPFGSADARVLAAVVPTGAGEPRNEVVSLTPGVSALVKLFVLQGTPAYAVRCLQYGVLPTLLVGQALCGVTQGDALHIFKLDKNNPAALPVVQKIDSPGALGLEASLSSKGLPRMVVANYAANTLLVVDFAADGSVAAQRSEPVDAACKKPAHAVPFVHAGKDYVAGTCNESNHYFVRELVSF